MPSPLGSLDTDFSDLMIIDIPNINSAIRSRLGRQPYDDDWPDYSSLKSWFATRKSSSQATQKAMMFANAEEDPERRNPLQNFSKRAINQGYYVLVKPRSEDKRYHDIDEEMRREIDFYHRSKELKLLVVVSHDSRNFHERLVELAQSGVTVLVVGFFGDAGAMQYSSEYTFIDFSEIPGFLPDHVPVTPVDLSWLPPQGRIFAPAAHKR